MEKSIIHAFRQTLLEFRFSEPNSFSEAFAQKRYAKKLESPDLDRSAERRQECWDQWIDFDRSLPTQLCLPPGQWYNARLELFRVLDKFRSGPVGFSAGSEFTPTRGHNSIEAKLCSSSWDCTVDNFEHFARTCYRHSGLKRAARKRFSNVARGFNETEREINLYLYNRARSLGVPAREMGYSIFSWKLRFVVSFVKGSRFSTVPKNNEKDRPINIEPFCNVLVQRSIGEGIRRVLKDSYDVDLDSLADSHRRLIRLPGLATIDLKNASDSVSLALCDFLLPKGFRNMLENARSQFVLGLDGDYHLTNKISSMGNGFTFELMTLLLHTLGRALDPQFSVFGDDIIISKAKAKDLIYHLEAVGFVVNLEKSFIEGPFRESCGANYHDAEGYVESFDFAYPEDIHDCIVTFNKVTRLSRSYRSFGKLRKALLRHIPEALQGPRDPLLDSVEITDLIGSRGVAPGAHALRLESFFQTGRSPLVTPKGVTRIEADRKLKELCHKPEEFRFFYGFSFSPTLRSPTLSHLKPNRNWAKYLMYLSSGRRAKDVIVGRGIWTRCLYITDGTSTFRWKSLR